MTNTTIDEKTAYEALQALTKVLHKIAISTLHTHLSLRQRLDLIADLTKGNS